MENELILRSFTPDALRHGLVFVYWPLLIALAFYVAFLLTSCFNRERSPARQAFLNVGPSLLVYGWGLLTIVTTYQVRGWHGVVSPVAIGLTGIHATIALFAVTLAFALAVALRARLELEIGVPIGPLAAIGATYADIVFFALMMTPLDL